MKNPSVRRTVFFLWFFFSMTCTHADDATIRRALDGETLELTDGRVIRLIGVATNNVQPILVERFKASYTQIKNMPLSTLSTQAMAFVEKNVVGRNITLSQDPSNADTSHFDENGRLLAYVWYSIHSKAGEDASKSEKLIGYQSQDKLLNSELIKAGLGFVDTRKPFLQKEVYLRMEKEAAEKREGVWRSTQELYQEILNRARGSQSGSTAAFVPKDARELSLRTSWQKFAELIRTNPRDYRSYYERSWLGASHLMNRVSAENLQDADQAVMLSPFDPKCHMQRHFLLRLLERHSEADDAYKKTVRLAVKLGMKTAVSDLVQSELKTPFFEERNTSEDMNNFMEDAIRAGANEDHFLLFMARFKSYGDNPPIEIQVIYREVSGGSRFQEFFNKYQSDLPTLKSTDLIYKTQWAQKGLDSPEEVIQWMETFGLYIPPVEAAAPQSKRGQTPSRPKGV